MSSGSNISTDFSLPPFPPQATLSRTLENLATSISTLISSVNSGHNNSHRFPLNSGENSIPWLGCHILNLIVCGVLGESIAWKHIPPGSMKGPKIAINPRVLMRLRCQPRVCPPPRTEDLRQKEKEKEAETGVPGGELEYPRLFIRFHM